MRRAAKTWGGDFYKNGGGGAVWDGFAYDPEANLVYVGTGNAQPWVQKFRGAQDLDNLYTCAILAVDLNTALAIAAAMPANILRVADSGINNHADLHRLQNAGFPAFLVGESLMRQPDVTAATRALLGIS